MDIFRTCFSLPNRKITLWYISFFYLCHSYCAFALPIEEARTLVESTPVYLAPSLKKPASHTLTKGSPLWILHVPKKQKGWEAVLLPPFSTTFWIPSTRIARASELRPLGLQIHSTSSTKTVFPYHQLKVTSFYQGSLTRPKTFQSFLKTPTKTLYSSSWGLEVGFRLNTLWSLDIQFLNFSFQSTTANSQKTYQFQSKALIFLGEYFLIHALPWKLALSLGGGGTFDTTVSAPGANAGPFVTALALGRLTGYFYISETFSVFLTSGYRYFLPKDVSLNQNTFQIRASAAYFEAGLQVEFY